MVRSYCADSNRADSVHWLSINEQPQTVGIADRSHMVPAGRELMIPGRIAARLDRNHSPRRQRAHKEPALILGHRPGPPILHIGCPVDLIDPRPSGFVEAIDLAQGQAAAVELAVMDEEWHRLKFVAEPASIFPARASQVPVHVSLRPLADIKLGAMDRKPIGLRRIRDYAHRLQFWPSKRKTEPSS